MSDTLHREAVLNFDTVLAAARRAFEAQDFDSARRKLKAADAIIERVTSRQVRAA